MGQGEEKEPSWPFMVAMGLLAVLAWPLFAARTREDR